MTDNLLLLQKCHNGYSEAIWFIYYIMCLSKFVENFMPEYLVVTKLSTRTTFDNVILKIEKENFVGQR
jgi:hypothetical protein